VDKKSKWIKKYSIGGFRKAFNRVGPIEFIYNFLKMKTFSKLMNLAIIVSLVVGATSCKEDEDPQKDVTSDSFQHSGHSYLVVKEKKTWTAAAADAFSRGGYLVEIEDQAEQNAVYAGIRASGVPTNYVAVPDGGGAAYLWIGAADYTEGTWVWNGDNQSGNAPVFWLGDKKGAALVGAFVNWGGKSTGTFNEPDNYTDSSVAPNGQDAAAIAISNWPYGKAGEWNDLALSNALYYVVEFDED
jgi:hypothetical protein